MAGKWGDNSLMWLLSEDIIATTPSDNIFVNKRQGKGVTHEQAQMVKKQPKMTKNSIYSHFSLFVLAYGQPLDPISAFIDKNVITGCCCNDIYGKRDTAGYYHPVFPPFA